MVVGKSMLSREDWIAAALDALTEGGVPAVAVEPIAKRLGVTKGSFYWHFKDRDQLLAATMETWERERTEALIDRLDAIDDPRARLAEWVRHAFAADKALLVGLHATADHPVVSPVLRRVTERRVEWLSDLLREAGVPRAAALRRARLLYSADLGLFQIARVAPGERPTERELAALVREIQDTFMR
jgi:AcrR family transcriptional regulator